MMSRNLVFRKRLGFASVIVLATILGGWDARAMEERNSEDLKTAKSPHARITEDDGEEKEPVQPSADTYSHEERILITINGKTIEEAIGDGTLTPRRSLNISGDNVTIDFKGNVKEDVAQTVCLESLNFNDSIISKVVLEKKVDPDIRGYHCATQNEDLTSHYRIDEIRENGGTELIDSYYGLRLDEFFLKVSREGLILGNENLIFPPINNYGGECIINLEKYNSELSFDNIKEKLSIVSDEITLKSCFFRTPVGIYIRPNKVRSIIKEIAILPREFIYESEDGLHQSRTCMVSGNIDFLSNTINLDVYNGYLGLAFDPLLTEMVSNVPLSFSSGLDFTLENEREISTYNYGLQSRDKFNLEGNKDAAQAALMFFKSTLQFNNSHVGAMHNIAMIYLKLMNPERAKKWFAKAAALGFEPSDRNLKRFDPKKK